MKEETIIERRKALQIDTFYREKSGLYLLRDVIDISEKTEGWKVVLRQYPSRKIYKMMLLDFLNSIDEKKLVEEVVK